MKPPPNDGHLMNQYPASSVSPNQQQVGWIKTACKLIEGYYRKSAALNSGKIFSSIPELSTQVMCMEKELVVPNELIIITHLTTINTLRYLMWIEKLWMSNPTVLLNIACFSILKIAGMRGWTTDDLPQTRTTLNEASTTSQTTSLTFLPREY